MKHLLVCAFLGLAVTACGRPIELFEGAELLHFTVTPTFLCDNSSCIVQVSYQIDSVEEVSSELGVTGPDGVYSVLSTAPLSFEISIAGDDSSIWTAGAGRYVFSLRTEAETLGDVGEAQLEREVIRFEDTYSIPHSAAVAVEPGQFSVTDYVQFGEIAADAPKTGRSYQVCSKGPVLLGISYDVALTVSPSNGEYPTALDIAGRRDSGASVFEFESVRPGEIREVMPPVELSDLVVVETVAESGPSPFPFQETVRWRLGFALGCGLEG